MQCQSQMCYIILLGVLGCYTRLWRLATSPNILDLIAVYNAPPPRALQRYKDAAPQAKQNSDSVLI